MSTNSETAQNMDAIRLAWSKGLEQIRAANLPNPRRWRTAAHKSPYVLQVTGHTILLRDGLPLRRGDQRGMLDE